MSRTKTNRLRVTADDSTSALEIGGVVAIINSLFLLERCLPKVPVESSISIQDMFPKEAYERMRSVEKDDTTSRCRKMESGLRDNWPHEIRVLLERRFPVAIISGFPAAGRRCKDGIVFVDDVPLLEAPYGADPLSAPCSDIATLNANYLMSHLEQKGFEEAFPTCRATHEFIVTLEQEKDQTEFTVKDATKRLLDMDIHSPTPYFPLLVSECFLIEATETESKETLNDFVQNMGNVRVELTKDPTAE